MPRSEEWNRKISESIKRHWQTSRKGWKASPETKTKLHLRRLEQWRGGMSVQTREKMRLARIGKKRPEFSGSKHPNWKGGRDKKNKVILNAHYKARKRGAPGYFTLGEWEILKKQHDYICCWCGKKEPAIKLTVDHIIALKNGGSNWIENIQPLCGPCNSRKGSTVI